VWSCDRRSNKTAVSETIRKPPLAEAQSALGKQKITFCGTRVGLSVPLPKFCEKLRTQNLTEIGQSAAALWPKNDFNMAAVRHLAFKNITFGHVTAAEFQISCCVPNFIEIG